MGWVGSGGTRSGGLLGMGMGGRRAQAPPAVVARARRSRPAALSAARVRRLVRAPSSSPIQTRPLLHLTALVLSPHRAAVETHGPRLSFHPSRGGANAACCLNRLRVASLSRARHGRSRGARDRARAAALPRRAPLLHARVGPGPHHGEQRESAREGRGGRGREHAGGGSRRLRPRGGAAPSTQAPPAPPPANPQPLS